MRIVSGKYKGRILKSPEGSARPTLDKVKQAIFTKLQFDIEGKNILDLFAGSGSLGIECISRGAKKVTFVDNSSKSIMNVKNNLKLLNEEAVIIKKDFKEAIKSFSEKFDIIFLDPPYAKGYYNEALELIKQKDLLNDDGIIVVEVGNEYSFQQNLFNEFDEKRYGTVLVKYLNK